MSTNADGIDKEIIIMVKKIIKMGKRKPENKEILINIEPLETRVAILENGKLDNFHIEL